jgi:hypothetical protein
MRVCVKTRLLMLAEKVELTFMVVVVELMGKGVSSCTTHPLSHQFFEMC